jgi:MFS family permease
VSETLPERQTGAPGRLGPLRHHNFRLLVAGTGTSSLGNAITPVALAFAVLELGGSASELGLVLAAFALAEVVTVLLGGVLGDRVSRQLMMEGSAAACAAVQAILATTLVTGVATIPMLTGFGVATGCLAVLSSPSSQAMTRLTVPPEELGSAVSVRRIAQTSAQIVGYSLGGVLVATVGPGWSIAVDAATYTVAAGCFALLRVPHVRPDSEDVSMLTDLGVGVREVMRHTWLWLLIGQALLYHLFYGGAQGVLGPIVVKDTFGIEAWGWALGALMAGFVVGGLITLRWRPRHGLRAGAVLLTLTAAFPLAMALSDLLPVVLLGAFLHGLGLEIFSVNWDLSIQQNIPEDRLARVYAFDIVGSFVARPLGLALTGPVAEAIGFDRWLVIVAVVMGGSASLSLLSRDVRQLERRPLTPAR